MSYLSVILSVALCLPYESVTFNEGQIVDDPLLDMFRKQEVLLQKVNGSISNLDRKIIAQVQDLKHAIASHGDEMEKMTRKLECFFRGFFPNDFGCYKFLYEDLSYDDAILRCRQYQSHLVEVQSKDEYEALISLMDQHGAVNNKWYQLGGRKVNNVWIWSQSMQPFTFTNWRTSGDDVKECAYFVYRPGNSDHKKWNGEDCTYKMYPVCEI